MKFECQDSCKGKCCSSSWNQGWGFVFLTKGDIAKLSKYLNKAVSEFADYGQFRFTRFSAGPTAQWFLKTNLGTCRFFKNGKCGVYEARPTQCRTFPFWPEYMKPQSWEKLKSICPGIGEGKDFGPQAFFEQLNADKELCNLNK